ncbi:MAG: hypothetical protein KTR18_00505 [Acidiferrobacterales bacterium]|nr:hypothetical protein [Acidiferrobacterales bacterium]
MFTSATGADISLDTKDWHLLSYRGIPSHTISNTQGALSVSVKRSASPLITLLDNPRSVKELDIKATIVGDLVLSEVTQGNKGADDFRLRVGLIFAGHTVVDPFQLSVAPSWIKRLHTLLPKNLGVSHVQFWNTYLDASLANQQRIHPTTDRWRENFVLEVDAEGKIQQRLEISETAKLLGIWISSDGDDTGSCFEVKIERLGVH